MNNHPSPGEHSEVRAGHSGRNWEGTRGPASLCPALLSSPEFPLTRPLCNSLSTCNGSHFAEGPTASEEQLGEDATGGSQASEPGSHAAGSHQLTRCQSARLSRWHVWHSGLLSVDAGESQRASPLFTSGLHQGILPGDTGAPNIDTCRSFLSAPWGLGITLGSHMHSLVIHPAC